MVDASTYVSELEGKHQESFRQLVAAFTANLTKDNLAVTDVLKLEMRAVVEAIEVAALWLPDSEELEMKIALGSRAGECAQHFRLLGERLAALGVPLATFDARHGGYSKLFAFFRSLQTTEERAAAGFLTLGGLNLARFEALAQWCQERGDGETAAIYRGRLTEDEQRHVSEGRALLIRVAESEESQARARRSTYRTVEVVGELQDPGLLRKFLSRSVKK
jgi:uncharacterized ferritin-like protein (DUF455 family)